VKLDELPWNWKRGDSIMIHARVIFFTPTKFFVAFWTAWIPPAIGEIKVNNQSLIGES
jgi:hypothetical protein